MNERDYDIHLFKPEDAPGVAQLFGDVYGDGYPVKIVYNPEEFVVAFENREYIPILAKTQDNRIVGFASFYRSAPYKGLYELGQVLVLPDYRKTSIAGLLLTYAMKAASSINGIDAVFGEAVCNHTHTQRAGAALRYVEMAMEIDLMPSEAYEKEQSASGRVSTVNMFRTVVQNPHTVYTPQAYEDYCRYVYSGFDDSRIIKASEEHLPPESSLITTQIFDFAQVARLTVHNAGRDFGTVIDGEESRVKKKNCVVIQVWLKMSWPWIGDAVGALKKRGYFLGGVLPRWFNEDGLLVQKLIEKPNLDGINLYSDRAAQILRFIEDDRQKIFGG